jgi:hypothetical protein
MERALPSIGVLSGVRTTFGPFFWPLFAAIKTMLTKPHSRRLYTYGAE